MSLLITSDQIAPYRAITANISSVKDLEPYIREAQEFDLRLFLGEQLYLDLMADFLASPSLQKYGDVYNPKQYTYGNFQYQHDGLIPVMAYFVYARYVANAGTKSTKNGLVIKKNEYSDPISGQERGRLISAAKSAATVYQERVKLFLDFNYSTYPLWRFGTQRKKGSIRLTAVGGNNKLGQYRRACIHCGYPFGQCGCNPYQY